MKKITILILFFYTFQINSNIPDLLSDSLKDIPDLIQYQDAQKDPLIKDNPTEFLHKWWNDFGKKTKETGLDLGFSYTCLYQQATSGITHREAGGGDFDFFGLWTIVEKEKPHPFSIGFSTEYRHKFTRIPPSLLGAAIGSLWPTVGGFSEFSYSLVELWGEYHIISKILGFRFGKIDISDYFNLYSFINSNFNFLESGLTSDLTIPFPENSLGFVVEYRYNDKNIFLFSMGDLNGSKESLSFNTFFDKREYFYALGYYYLNEGNFNITLWYADSIKKYHIPSGCGCAFSYEKEFENGFLPFLRYGFSTNECTEVSHCLALGFGVLKPFNRKNDEFGLGMVYGKPSWNVVESQLSFETYYRLQLTGHLQITPDVEVILNPSFFPDKEIIAIFSIRARFDI